MDKVLIHYLLLRVTLIVIKMIMICKLISQINRKTLRTHLKTVEKHS
jgi:hypothetical protein